MRHLKIHSHRDAVIKAGSSSMQEIFDCVLNIGFYTEDTEKKGRKQRLLATRVINQNYGLVLCEDNGWKKEVSLSNRQRFDFGKNYEHVKIRLEFECRDITALMNDLSKFNIAYCVDKTIIGVIVMMSRDLDATIRPGAINFERARDVLKGPFWSSSDAPLLLIGLTEHNENDNSFSFMERSEMNTMKNPGLIITNISYPLSDILIDYSDEHCEGKKIIAGTLFGGSK